MNTYDATITVTYRTTTFWGFETERQETEDFPDDGMMSQVYDRFRNDRFFEFSVGSDGVVYTFARSGEKCTITLKSPEATYRMREIEIDAAIRYSGNVLLRWTA